MTNLKDIKLPKDNSLFRRVKYSKSMEEKGYFESVRQKSKAEKDQQLLGHTAERGFFGKIKNLPLLANEQDVEKGVLISGSVGSGISETKNIFLYNQLKKGMGGLVLSSGDNSEIYKLCQMMQDVDRNDIVFINGVDKRENRKVWDFFENATTEEILIYLNVYLDDNYEEIIVQKVKPIIKRFFQYYRDKNFKLNLDNIHEYFDFKQKHFDAIRLSHPYPKNDIDNNVDQEFTEWCRKGDRTSDKLLHTATALLLSSLTSIKEFCNCFKFSEQELDFRKNISENKVIYAFGPCNYRYPEHSKIFNILVMERYLKTLNELTSQGSLCFDSKGGKSHFFMYNSDNYRKIKEEVDLIESAIRNRSIYAIYVSRDIEGDCTNKRLLESVKSLPMKVIMKTEYVSSDLMLFLNRNKKHIVNQRDLQNQGPGEAHISFNDKTERIKAAYFSGAQILDLEKFVGYELN